MNRLAPWGLLLACCLPAVALAQDEAATEHPAHDELRELRETLLTAVDKSDIDGMLAALHPDVVITFMDGTQCDGPDAVKAYFKKMLEGADGKPAVVKKFSTKVDVAELTTLYGDEHGVAYGTASSTFDLTDGSNFTVDGYWTASVVKQEGDWKVTAFHSSAGLFENPLLDLATGWITKAAIIAGVAGLVLGAGAVWFVKRK